MVAYTLTGTNTFGCKNTKSLSLTVNSCNSLLDNTITSTFIKVYPNPSDGNVTIEIEEASKIELYNLLGEVLFMKQLETGIHPLELTQFNKSNYVLQVHQKFGIKSLKLIVH